VWNPNEIYQATLDFMGDGAGVVKKNDSRWIMTLLPEEKVSFSKNEQTCTLREEKWPPVE
jgi:hypothetical protein